MAIASEIFGDRTPLFFLLYPLESFKNFYTTIRLRATLLAISAVLKPSWYNAAIWPFSNIVRRVPVLIFGYP